MLCRLLRTPNLLLGVCGYENQSYLSFISAVACDNLRFSTGSSAHQIVCFESVVPRPISVQRVAALTTLESLLSWDPKPQRKFGRRGSAAAPRFTVPRAFPGFPLGHFFISPLSHSQNFPAELFASQVSVIVVNYRESSTNK